MCFQFSAHAVFENAFMNQRGRGLCDSRRMKCNVTIKINLLYEMEEGKMNKKKGIISVALVMVMFCMMSITVHAQSSVPVSLPENQVWTSGIAVSRGPANFSYVAVSLDSVYPLSGSDHFTKIQARLVDASGNVILKDAEYVVLTEGTGFAKLYIQEGYLSLKTVYLQFRGNKSDAANAVVSFYAF